MRIDDYYTHFTDGETKTENFDLQHIASEQKRVGMKL
jgi:hypothetical protein